MRKLAITMALASTVLATPALARDNSAYVGIEGGLMVVEDTDLDFVDRSDDTELVDVISIDHKVGYDIDIVGGYDFGPVRLEAELAYKRASLDEITIDPVLSGLTDDGPFDVDGRATVLSGMINGLLDFGDDDGWGGYIGPGIGLARVKYSVDNDDADFTASDSSSGFAWQIVAGVRAAVSPNIDLGLKYRFFNFQQVRFDDEGSEDAEFRARFRSHSLLLSLIYNLAAPVPPPPPPPPPAPPPPPPATQTCPDGTVILATDVCPAPPPPPPPPPPAPERG